MDTTKSFLIGALIAGVAILGYLYYQETKNDVAIDVPSVEVE